VSIDLGKMKRIQETGLLNSKEKVTDEEFEWIMKPCDEFDSSTNITEKEKAIIRKIIKENDKELDKLEEGL